MKIFHIGCSHSIHGSKPLTATVAERLPKSIEYYSFAHFCSSVHNQLYAVHRLIPWNPDLVVVQWTTPARMTFVEDRDRFDSIYKPYNTKKITKNYYQLDRNFPDYANARSKSGLALHVNATSSTRMPKKNRRRIAYETMAVESLSEVGVHGYIFLSALKRYAKQMLTEAGIPHIFYEQNNATGHDDDILDFVVDQKLGKKQFDSLLIDDGFHFGEIGNTLVRDRFLIPLIEEKLDVQL